MQMRTGESVENFESDRIEVATSDINNQLTSHRATGTLEVPSITDGEDVTGTGTGDAAAKAAQRCIPLQRLCCGITIRKTGTVNRRCDIERCAGSSALKNK